MMRAFSLSIIAALLMVQTFAHAADETEWDIVVYGGTSSGVTAAVQAARMGRKVVLIEPGKHLGGMSSGGLGMTDIGSAGTIGGLADEFYAGVYNYYLKPEAWRQDAREPFFEWMPDNWGVDGKRAEETKRQYLFEPHAAERVFVDMLKTTAARVVYGERLNLKNGVKKDGTRILSITMESGRVFHGKAFVDTTYEGDLLAKAGVKYIVGREPNSQYNETLNGKFPTPPVHIKIDPYVIPGDPSSGILPPAVLVTDPGKKGEGDDLVQAYNYRLCLTDARDNQVAITKPANYNPKDYELLARWIVSKADKLKPGPSRIGHVALGGKNSNIGINFDLIPNRKTDSNDGSHFGSDLAGASKNWPEGDYAERERIGKRVRDYTLGLLWFLGNDARVPQEVRSEMLRWGLARDEFTDNGNFPHQIYVREARRMISDYVMTDHDGFGKARADDSIALASYPLDSHSASYYVHEGKLYREPGFYAKSQVFPISYRAIRPRAAECTNLTVGGCISATHAAYGSVRMEPVFMMLGQAAGAAAAISAESGQSVQDIPYAKLRERLLADKAKLDAPKKKDPTPLSAPVNP
jgi:hypothetical protein